MSRNRRPPPTPPGAHPPAPSLAQAVATIAPPADSAQLRTVEAEQPTAEASADSAQLRTVPDEQNAAEASTHSPTVPSAHTGQAECLDERERRPPSWEDFQAEVERQEAEDAAALAADRARVKQQAQAAVDRGPNPDIRPPANLTCPDPLWVCTCPGEPIPRNTIQAPTAELAQERYRQKFLIRRPKVKVTKA